MFIIKNLKNDVDDRKFFDIESNTEQADNIFYSAVRLFRAEYCIKQNDSNTND